MSNDHDDIVDGPSEEALEAGHDLSEEEKDAAVEDAESIDDTSVENLTKKEIKERLKSHRVKFDPDAKKEDLLGLLVEIESGDAETGSQVTKEAVVSLEKPSWADQVLWDSLDEEKRYKLVKGEDWRS